MIESIVRPFQSGGVDPQPFDVPGQVGVPLVRVQCGTHGGSKTFSYSFSATTTYYIMRVHKESKAIEDDPTFSLN